MKKSSNIIVLISILILSGLTFWQVKNLQEMIQLKAESELNEMQAVLMNSAIELRRTEKRIPKLRTDSIQAKKVIDSILDKNFKNYNQDIIWGYYNGLEEPIQSLNNQVENTELRESSLKICVSCLIMIGVVKNIDSNNIEEGDLDESGFILDQTPAQMRDVRGMEAASLKYLHILVTPIGLGISSYIIPFVFLVALSSLFIWLLYLNRKQGRLIKQKNEFVNHLSHQFQTPLSSIKLSANLLANKETINPRELVKIIQTEANRLENHIKTVLHWVKSDADRLQISKTSISLTNIIEQSLKQMKPVFLTNHTTINFVPPEEEFQIQADENHLQLMLFNIWENAIKHNDTSIQLNVTCEKKGNEIIITTTDDGKGIQKLDKNIKFKGLGLQYIRRIMKEHSGAMVLSNNGNNKGLTLTLIFPNNG